MFARRVEVFPPPGPDRRTSFFAETVGLETQPGRWTARRFVFSTLAGAAVFGLQWSSAIDTWKPSTLPQLEEWRFGGAPDAQ